jgi:5S rRNA maturation endonuclease (ribonuclease M5)
VPDRSIAALGHHPAKTTNQGQELWYHSPFRKDKTPSFHTSYLNGKWIWNDFGGKGGTVIDFALQHLSTSNISEALTFLDDVTGGVGEGQILPVSKTSNVSPLLRTSAESRTAKGAGGEGKTLELVSAKPISNPLIINYLTKTRQIPQPLISRHLTEVTYQNTTTNKQFFAFGLLNRAGGYEIRSASDDHPFKSVIGPRDITFTPGSNPKCGIVSIFEGTLDFLSLLAIMKLDQLEGDAIVMHSLSSYQKTVATLHTQNYKTINLFLDNDQSGVDVAFQFLKDIPNAVNQSDLFHPHEDLNAFLLASANSSDIPNASNAPPLSQRPPQETAQRKGPSEKGN